MQERLKGDQESSTFTGGIQGYSTQAYPGERGCMCQHVSAWCCGSTEVSRREEAVLEMLARCGLYGLQMPSARLRRITSTPVLQNRDADSRARILITSSVADAECLSACEVFQIMLQVQCCMLTADTTSSSSAAKAAHDVQTFGAES